MSEKDTFDALLKETLSDRVLQRGEDKKLRDLMAKVRPNPSELDRLVARAFAVAEDHLKDTPSREVVRWLKGVVAALEERPAVDVAGNPEAWFSPEADCVGRILRFLDAANQSLDICVFTITDDRIASAIERAHRRSVAVRILTDDQKSGDLGSDIERLIKAGIPLRLDRSPFHMHHKFAIADQRELLTGSYNWTRSAATSNEENFVITRDPSLLRLFAAEFRRLWDTHAPR